MSETKPIDPIFVDDKPYKSTWLERLSHVIYLAFCASGAIWMYHVICDAPWLLGIVAFAYVFFGPKEIPRLHMGKKE